MISNKLECYDALNLKQDEKIRKYLKKPQEEIIQYSESLIKINKSDAYQTRIILITDQGIYNIKKKEIRRFMLIDKIDGVTISNSSNEFVIHEKDSYDLRYESENRELVLKHLIYVSQVLRNKQLPIYFVDIKLLAQYCTNEDDAKKKRSKKPIQDPIYTQFSKINIFFSNKLLKENNSGVLFINYDNIFRVWLDDFKAKYILAEGTLSKIYLVLFKEDNTKVYALKHITEQQLGKVLKEELHNDVVNHVNTNFVEPLEFAFRRNDEFFFFFKLMKGGDLYSLINRRINLKENEEAKFYFIEILLGLRVFHNKNIVYGDLKPENILLDSEGHVNLVDFGSSRCVEKDTDIYLYTTLEYTAPEVLMGNKKSFASDYWALGNILYEMVIGIAPFYNENENLVMHLIISKQIHFPNKDSNIKISEECQNMILGLLQENPSKRLNFDSIKMHPWLQDVDWVQYENMMVNVPLSLKPEQMEKSYVNKKYFEYKKIPESQVNLMKFE